MHLVFVAAGLVAIAIIPHASTVTASFSVDDRAFVAQNPAIRSVGAALAGFGHSFPPSDPARGLYRPVTQLSFAVEHALFGLRPGPFHAGNLLLHALCTLLAWGLLRRLVGDRVALVAALLFAAHPVHAEAVDNISGRSELLGLGFALLSLHALASRGRLATLGAVIAFALACFSKESAVGLVGVVTVYGLVAWPVNPGFWRRLGLLWCVAAGWFALRAAVLPSLQPAAVVLGGAPAMTKMCTVGALFAEYARLLVWPSLLQIDFVYETRIGIVSGPTARAVAGWALICAAATGGLLLIRRYRQTADQAALTAAGGLVWMGAFLLPVSHVVDFGALMAERFLLSPSLGFCVAVAVPAVAVAQASTRRTRQLLGGLLVVLLLAAGVRSANRALQWRSDLALWQSAAAVAPNHPDILLNLGVACIEGGSPAEGASHLRAVLVQRPDDVQALLNLAGLHAGAGRLGEAAKMLDRVTASHPQMALAWVNRAVIAARAGAFDDARVFVDKALALEPEHLGARRLLQRLPVR